MSLTYQQIDALAVNANFLGRVRSAVSYYANYQLNNDAASQKTKTWAAVMYWAGQRLAQVSANMAPQLVQDGAVIGSSVGDGSDISDDSLQGAVNKICESYI